MKVGFAHFFYGLSAGIFGNRGRKKGIVNIGVKRIVERIQDYAEPLIEDMGLELVDVQFRREGHGWVLRIFIDREGGVVIDHCVQVSRALSAWLEVEDLIDHAYHLEVSSPGLERPLKKEEDFERFSGRKARVKLKKPLDGQRVFTGILEGIEGGSVVLLVDDSPVMLPCENIARARLAL